MAPPVVPPPAVAKLRVLALHSFRTSGRIFREQFLRAKLVETLGDLVEIVYLDAPNEASGPIPRDVKPYFDGPYYEWLTVEEMGDKLEFDEPKLERSLDTVSAVLREQGPFDGMVGFSQGSIMTSSIVALQAAGTILQDIPRFKFCVLFAGMPSRYPRHAEAFASKVAVPSLHVYGDRDFLKEHCMKLADMFANSVVLTHTKGHVIPALNDIQLAVFRAFLTAFLPGSSSATIGAPGVHHTFHTHDLTGTPTVSAAHMVSTGGETNGKDSSWEKSLAGASQSRSML